MGLEVGQRIGVYEILPTIRYDLPVGSWIGENKPPQSTISFINTKWGPDACCVNEKLGDIEKEVHLVGCMVIKTVKQ